jgi:hypothetical protein
VHERLAPVAFSQSDLLTMGQVSGSWAIPQVHAFVPSGVCPRLSSLGQPSSCIVSM